MGGREETDEVEEAKLPARDTRYEEEEDANKDVAIDDDTKIEAELEVATSHIGVGSSSTRTSRRGSDGIPPRHSHKLAHRISFNSEQEEKSLQDEETTPDEDVRRQDQERNEDGSSAIQSKRIYPNTRAKAVASQNTDTKQIAALQLAPAVHSNPENGIRPSSRKSQDSKNRNKRFCLPMSEFLEDATDDDTDDGTLPGAMHIDGDATTTDGTVEYSMTMADNEYFPQDEENFTRSARPTSGPGTNRTIMGSPPDLERTGDGEASTRVTSTVAQRHGGGVSGDSSGLELVEAFKVSDIGHAEIVRVEERDQNYAEEIGIRRGEAEEDELEGRNKIKQNRTLLVGGCFCCLIAGAIIIILWIVLADTPTIDEPTKITERTIQIIHSSEQESDLQDINTLEEKVLHFSAVVEGLRKLKSPASIHVATGDITLPGPFYTAAAEVESLDNQMGMGDIQILNAMKLDATALGNHEFDKGLMVFAKLLHESAFPFLSVNLDLNGAQVPEGVPKIVVGTDGSLCRDVTGHIVKSCVLETPIGRLGLIGRSPPDLHNLVGNAGETIPGITYYGGLDPDTGLPLVDSSFQIREQVRLLESQGIDIIILLDQSFDNFNELGEPQLTEEFEGIDVVIGEIWKSNIIFAQRDSFGPFNFLRPEDATGLSHGSYPLVRTDSSGNRVLFVNCGGLYRYVGNLIVTFDDYGFISSWDGRSGPLATSQEAIELLEKVVEETLEPVPLVSEIMHQLQNTPSIRDSFTVIGSTAFSLEGSRDKIRSRETNLGRINRIVWNWRRRVTPI